MSLGRNFGFKADGVLPPLSRRWRIGLAGTRGDTCLGNGLMCLQQALRADNHTVVGDELLVADIQLFTAFRTGPAHILGVRF